MSISAQRPLFTGAWYWDKAARRWIFIGSPLGLRLARRLGYPVAIAK